MQCLQRVERSLSSGHENRVHHYANSCFDWLISGKQSVNPWGEAISTLSGKYKRLTFVHSVPAHTLKTSLKGSY